MAIIPLPKLMVAPNGARRGKSDHLRLPVTISETVETAIACQKAGADGIHAHVRDANGTHVLDAGLYVELMAELKTKAPELAVQITTEAVGRYTPAEQRELVHKIMPKLVSVALGEQLPNDSERPAATDFYHFARGAEIAVQHILYRAEELEHLTKLIDDGVVPANDLQVLFVLGRYTQGQNSEPGLLAPFLQMLEQCNITADWAVCAFGHGETACLVEAAGKGGKVRVGFENSLLRDDGTVARDNAERVTAVREAISAVPPEPHLSKAR